LIFVLTIEPADPDEKKNIQKMPRMNAEGADLHLSHLQNWSRA
jgi:hypothetical protein